MKGVLVDFWSDTLDNLDDLSKTNDIPRNELIRRGSEAVLVLYGIPKSDIGEMLLEELKENQRILSNKPVNRTRLVRALSNSTALSSALSAIYAVNDGKEEASIIRIYFRTIQEHLLVISDSNYRSKEEDFETIRDDVTSFANVLAKLVKTKDELSNSANLPRERSVREASESPRDATSVMPKEREKLMHLSDSPKPMRKLR